MEILNKKPFNFNKWLDSKLKNVRENDKLVTQGRYANNYKLYNKDEIITIENPAYDEFRVEKLLYVIKKRPYLNGEKTAPIIDVNNFPDALIHLKGVGNDFESLLQKFVVTLKEKLEELEIDRNLFFNHRSILSKYSLKRIVPKHFYAKDGTCTVKGLAKMYNQEVSHDMSVFQNNQLEVVYNDKRNKKKSYYIVFKDDEITLRRN